MTAKQPVNDFARIACLYEHEVLCADDIQALLPELGDEAAKGLAFGLSEAVKSLAFDDYHDSLPSPHQLDKTLVQMRLHAARLLALSEFVPGEKQIAASLGGGMLFAAASSDGFDGREKVLTAFEHVSALHQYLETAIEVTAKRRAFHGPPVASRPPRVSLPRYVEVCANRYVEFTGRRPTIIRSKAGKESVGNEPNGDFLELMWLGVEKARSLGLKIHHTREALASAFSRLPPDLRWAFLAPSGKSPQAG